jgi:hypothetical protein
VVAALAVWDFFCGHLHVLYQSLQLDLPVRMPLALGRGGRGMQYPRGAWTSLSVV